MKSMIVAALVVGGLFAWNPSARAGDTNVPSAPSAAPKGPGSGAFERLARQLDLTADQKPKVQAILEAQGRKMHALRTDATLSEEDRHAKMQAAHEDAVTQLKGVLTPEQFGKWQTMGSRGRRTGGPGNAGAWPSAGEKHSATNAPAASPKN